MLLMLMPGLACGPFMHASTAHAAPLMQGMENCHGMGMDGAAPKSNIGGRFLFKDCLHVDLHGASCASLPAPDLYGKAVFTAWTAMFPERGYLPPAYRAVRGPPDPPGLPRPHISILTTQRLLI